MTLQKIVGSSADADLKDSERLGFEPRLSARGEYSEPRVASYFAQYAIYLVRIHPCKKDENHMFTILMAEVICGRSYDCGHKRIRFQRPPPNDQGETCHSVEGTEPGLDPDKIKDISDEWFASLHSDKSEREFARQIVVYDRLMAYPHFIITLREMKLEFCEDISNKSVFEFEPVEADWISIKTCDGKYISVTNGGNVRLASHRCDLGKFKRVAVPNSEPLLFRLRTVKNRWLSAQENGGIGLELNCGDPGDREKFKFVPEDENGNGSKVALVSPGGFGNPNQGTYRTVK